ncbi:hypothetical protein WR25_02154 [Diploscapter pachys]|uniref:Uncharacterized protein n=1 Tax=Diploscapter pachys TaxID=2018661 RepID=A0A2A2KMI8_9BILA|nr:hypothetical protein WR25_02154 [Diploscapter pachys]
MTFEVNSRCSTPDIVEPWTLKVSRSSKVILQHIYNGSIDQISCTRIVSPSGRYEFLHFTTKWLVQQGIPTTVYLFLDNQQKCIVEYYSPWNLVHRGTLGFYWLDDEVATILAINKHRREGTIILSQFKIDLDHRNRTLITRVKRDYVSRYKFDRQHIFCMQDFERLTTTAGEINCSNYALKDPCREMIRRKDPKVQRAIETAFYLRKQRKARSKAKSGLINFLKEVVERIKKVIRFFIKRANSMEMSC